MMSLVTKANGRLEYLRDGELCTLGHALMFIIHPVIFANVLF